jgi:glycogen operon protein
MWYRHDGREMDDGDWENPVTASLGLFLAGRGIDDIDEEGNPVVDDDFFLILNGSDVPLEFALPRVTDPTRVSSDDEVWRLLLDTNDDRAEGTARQGERTHVVPRSLKLFVHVTDKSIKAPPFSLR